MARSTVDHRTAGRVSVASSGDAGRPSLPLSLLLAVGAVVALVACSRSGPAPRDPAPPARVGRMTSLDARMHENIRAVRAIHAALVRNDVDAARDQATQLARVEAEGAIGAWEEPLRLLREQADRVAAATEKGEVRRLATELATFCADCHMVNAREARFRAPPMPASDGSLRSAMARHQWAADSMWLGIVGPSTPLWRAGLDAIGDLPITAEHAPTREARLGMERFRRRLEALRSSGDHELAGQNDRAGRLAAVLEVCAGCHAIARP